MKKRMKLKSKYSRKNFTRNAMKINSRNGQGRPMRGGIRM
jgi:hypothetical protein